MQLQAILLLFLAAAACAQEKRNPAAWGGNHSGEAIPEFVHGDECLFCHREDIGNLWKKNRHGTTVREKEDAPDLLPLLAKTKLAADVTHFLGSREHVRFLHKEGYGTFWISSADGSKWEKEKFARQCAGCHSTAVEAASNTFSAFGLDCYTCHGVVSLEHSKDTSLVWLSKKKRSDVLAMTSICAQCHLRGAKSKSTGLPYPNNFVAGDNLFQDYVVDLAKADDASLNAGDRHVYRNVRDVVLNASDTTCLSCHRVHAMSTEKHRRVLSGPNCQDCHNAEGPKKALKPYAVHSALCEY